MIARKTSPKDLRRAHQAHTTNPAHQPDPPYLPYCVLVADGSAGI
jgi:hypothetical protein